MIRRLIAGHFCKEAHGRGFHGHASKINRKTACFSPENLCFSLEFKFNLSHLKILILILKDNCYVKLCIVMYVDECNDLKEKIIEASEGLLACSEIGESENLVERNLRNNFNIIELSPHVKLYFEPLVSRKFM